MSIDVPQSYFTSVNFPIPFTTTQMDGAVPDLTNYVDFDLPLSAKFSNLGAPRFIFNKEEMSVLFDMEVEFFDEFYIEKIMTITFRDIYIDFDMWLEDMKIRFEWQTVSLGSAHVESTIIENLKTINADEHVVDYFNWAFQFITTWVNDNQIEGINVFEVPQEITGVMKI